MKGFDAQPDILDLQFVIVTYKNSQSFHHKEIMTTLFGVLLPDYRGSSNTIVLVRTTDDRNRAPTFVYQNFDVITTLRGSGYDVEINSSLQNFEVVPLISTFV